MKNKMPVALLLASLISVGGGIALHDKIAVNENFTDTAIQPVPGDPWTIGHGTTVYADGTPVKPGDKITKKQALQEMVAHVSGNEKAFVESLPGVELSHEEYVEYLDFVYQFGIGNWRKSSMRQYLLASDYVAACSVLPQWRNVRGADCSLRKNQCGNGQDCRGVWDRTVRRYQNCMIANGTEFDPTIRKSEPCK